MNRTKAKKNLIEKDYFLQTFCASAIVRSSLISVQLDTIEWRRLVCVCGGDANDKFCENLAYVNIYVVYVYVIRIAWVLLCYRCFWGDSSGKKCVQITHIIHALPLL